jgi:hypothetical protein
MKTKLLLLAAIWLGVTSSASFAMTVLEYTAQRDTIVVDYKLSRSYCRNLNANAKGVCKSNAKGVRNRAQAKLEAVYATHLARADTLELAKR